MDAFQSRFAQSLCDKLEKSIVDASGKLIETPATDFPAYRQAVGFIRGLQHVLKEARELEHALGLPEKKTESVAQPRRSYEA